MKHIITPIQDESVSASCKYTDDSLDFVFIDADHRYDSVVADIQAWLPKMKNGSILAGHDYAWCSDVRRAVHDSLGEGTNKYEDQYGIGYKSYDDPWKEGCWIVNIG